MTSSYVSRPLLTMLESAGITAYAVRGAIVRQTEKNGYRLLRAPHPYIRRLRRATTLNVTEIAWRYGRLLVTIEQLKDERIHWAYCENKSSYCSFRCRTQLPATVTLALRGKHLEIVTDEIDVLAGVRIARSDEQSAATEWLTLKLAPDWIAF